MRAASGASWDGCRTNPPVALPGLRIDREVLQAYISSKEGFKKGMITWGEIA